MKETIINLRNALRPIYGDRETEAIIRLIFHHLKGWSPTDIIIHEDDNLSDFTKSEISSIMHRLLNHEPIQYILGEQKIQILNAEYTEKVTLEALIPGEILDGIREELTERTSGQAVLEVLGKCCFAEIDRQMRVL